MENILVLGANGFIGGKLTDALIQDHFVVGYDFRPPIQKRDNLQYTHVCGDFTKEADFTSIIKRYEITVIYHLISTTTPKDGTAHVEQEIADNLLPTIRLLQAASECNVKKVIFASSGGTVYGECSGHPNRESDPLFPICSYGAQKAAIENLLSVFHGMHGLGYQVVRIGNPYGVCMQQGRTQGIIPLFIKALYENKGITLFGNTVRDYIYIDDVIDALIRVMNYQGKHRIFNIGSGIGVELIEIVAMIEQLSERTFVSIDKKSRRRCDVQESILDISMAKEELGWTPTTDLREGISRTVQQMRIKSEIGF